MPQLHEFHWFTAKSGHFIAFLATNDVASNDHVAVFAVFKTTKMALTVDDVINALENDNYEVSDAGISSDEEEELDRYLESSGDDSRQVFICF